MQIITINNGVCQYVLALSGTLNTGAYCSLSDIKVYCSTVVYAWDVVNIPAYDIKSIEDQTYITSHTLGLVSVHIPRPSP